MSNNLIFRTEVLPKEIPILFGNKVLYENITSDSENKFDIFMNLKATIPYIFKIPKKSYFRTMSLPHPIAQIGMYYFLTKYDTQIIAHCKNTPFSVRAPIKINDSFINDKIKIKKENRRYFDELNEIVGHTVSTEEILFEYNNYFSNKQYKKLSDLLSSTPFNRDKKKYDYYRHVDIQEFFSSIYTHSLSWAVFGSKSLGKLNSSENVFANTVDKINQKINFNETNGIIIGPEFSRVVSEILLTDIDIKLMNSLRDKSITFKKEYSLYRFIDDYYIFAKNKEIIDEIVLTLNNLLNSYKLSINSSKDEAQSAPFIITSMSINNLKKEFNNFRYQRLSRKIEGYIKFGNNYDENEIKDKLSRWNALKTGIEIIIASDYDSSQSVVRYFLKTLRKEINVNTVDRYKLAKIIEIITEIYSLSIEPISTSYWLAIYIDILNRLENSKYYNSQDIEYINEKIYENIYRILKNNSNKINMMYDCFPFMKKLTKKMPSSFLCKVLYDNKNDYFVYCSIAYYILNDNNDGLNPEFKTVKNVLYKNLEEYHNNYKDKGIGFNILDAEYFYFINDFIKYPGFNKKEKIYFNRVFDKDKKEFINNTKGNDVFKTFKAYLINIISKESYYNWHENYKSFEEKIIFKSINGPTDNGEFVYY